MSDRTLIPPVSYSVNSFAKSRSPCEGFCGKSFMNLSLNWNRFIIIKQWYMSLWSYTTQWIVIFNTWDYNISRADLGVDQIYIIIITTKIPHKAKILSTRWEAAMRQSVITHHFQTSAWFSADESGRARSRLSGQLRVGDNPQAIFSHKVINLIKESYRLFKVYWVQKWPVFCSGKAGKSTQYLHC